MTAPKPPRLLEGFDGMAVAGTHDVHTALQILVAEHASFIEYDRDMPSEDVPGLADWLNALIQDAQTDWWRKAHAMRGNCPCGDGHTWDALSTRAGSPGAFRVVWWS